MRVLTAIPTELQLRLLALLPPDELLHTIRLVSRRFHNLANDILPTILTIPTEILLRILSYIPPDELFHTIRLVSHRFHNLANDMFRKVILPTSAHPKQCIHGYYVKVPADCDDELEYKIEQGQPNKSIHGYVTVPANRNDPLEDEIEEWRFNFVFLSCTGGEVSYVFKEPDDDGDRAQWERILPRIEHRNARFDMGWRKPYRPLFEATRLRLRREETAQGELVWVMDWKRMMAMHFRNFLELRRIGVRRSCFAQPGPFWN